jgi:parallel beta-helix repeat protein
MRRTKAILGIATAIVVGAVLPATAAAVGTPASEPLASGQIRFVSPTGNDANPGTAAAPWRTLERANTGAYAGYTVYFRSGTYGERGKYRYFARNGTATAPITFKGYPGDEPPVILGMTYIQGQYVRMHGFVFDGPTGQVFTPSASNPRGEGDLIHVYGRGVEIARSEIRNSAWHAGVYLYGDPLSFNARLIENHIHDNGDQADPTHANVDHGIYWARGKGGLVANNVIERNVARGVQLYPSPNTVTIAHNTIVGNGKAGIQLGSQAAYNVIVDNVITNNPYGVQAYSLAGLGNVARTNLSWANGIHWSSWNGRSVSLVSNLVADPRYSAAGDYRLQLNSPAIDRATATSPPTTSDFDGVRRPRGPANDIGAFEAR